MRKLTPAQWGLLAENDSMESVRAAPMTKDVFQHLCNMTAGAQSYLEAGCFLAPVSHLLAESGRHVSVLDFSDEVLSLVNRNSPPRNLQGVYKRDLTDPDWPKGIDPHHVVWNCGVLEHFTTEDTSRVIRGMASIATRFVIVLVPNFQSTLYRIGKHFMEANGLWKWGYERPIATLRPEMESAGLVHVEETSICFDQALRFAERIPDFRDSLLGRVLVDTLRRDHEDCAVQGYLLLCVGKVPGHATDDNVSNNAVQYGVVRQSDCESCRPQAGQRSDGDHHATPVAETGHCGMVPSPSRSQGEAGCDATLGKCTAAVESARRYVLEHYDIKDDHKARLILAIVGGHPLADYLMLGYDWIGPYYNPCLMFSEVHYFQWSTDGTGRYDIGYPLYVHHAGTPDRIVELCRGRGVAVLRAYDANSGRLAMQAGQELGIPVVVSIH